MFVSWQSAYGSGFIDSVKIVHIELTHPCSQSGQQSLGETRTLLIAASNAGGIEAKV